MYEFGYLPWNERFYNNKNYTIIYKSPKASVTLNLLLIIFHIQEIKITIRYGEVYATLNLTMSVN